MNSEPKFIYTVLEPGLPVRCFECWNLTPNPLRETNSQDPNYKRTVCQKCSERLQFLSARSFLRGRVDKFEGKYLITAAQASLKARTA